jgi:hypothetical protein
LAAESHQKDFAELEKWSSEVAGRALEIADAGLVAGHFDGFAPPANKNTLYRGQQVLGVGFGKWGCVRGAFDSRFVTRGFQHLTGAVATLS